MFSFEGFQEVCSFSDAGPHPGKALPSLLLAFHLGRSYVDSPEHQIPGMEFSWSDTAVILGSRGFLEDDITKETSILLSSKRSTSSLMALPLLSTSKGFVILRFDYLISIIVTASMP